MSTYQEKLTVVLAPNDLWTIQEAAEREGYDPKRLDLWAYDTLVAIATGTHVGNRIDAFATSFQRVNQSMQELMQLLVRAVGPEEAQKHLAKLGVGSVGSAATAPAGTATSGANINRMPSLPAQATDQPKARRLRF